MNMPIKEKIRLLGIEENVPVAVINLKNIKHNAKKIAKITGVPLCAVVKSDAYGHGMVQTARALKGVASCFAVCNIAEGIKLRLSGEERPILCLLPSNDYQTAHQFGLTITVQSVKECVNLANYCDKTGNVISFHLAVNSGMNRLGINSLQELKQIIKICKCSGCSFLGIYSHLYNAKRAKDSNEQLKTFTPFCEEAKGAYKNIIAHIAASGGVSLGEEYYLDMVRVGLLMYGYNAINGTFKLKKCMQIYAKSIARRKVYRGQSLLYGDYKCKKDRRISIACYGYANGFERGNLNGLNSCCMNVCASEQLGEYVTVCEDAERFAKRCKASVYNVLTSLGNNANKIYLNGD